MGRGECVVIVGGGVAGLAAGGLLARRGLSVKLFEANDKLGGCCATTNLSGYTLNDGAVFLMLPGVLDEVFERLGLDRGSLLPMRRITAYSTTTLPDGSVVTIGDGLGEGRGDGLGVTVERSQGDVDRVKIQSELERMMKRWEPVLRAFPDHIARHPFSFWRMMLKGWRHLYKFRGTLASEMVRLFSDEAMRAAMSGTVLYSGLPPQETPVAAILGLVSLLCEGFWFPEGGIGRIPDVLGQALSDQGGEIFLNTKVKKIFVSNGRACGVEIAGRGRVEADAVISTTSGMSTFASLLDPEDVPIAMRRKVRRAPLSVKAISIQLGLTNRIAVPSFINCVLPMMDEQEKIFLPAENGERWPIFSVPTLVMPELAPTGGSIVEMFAVVDQEMPARDWDEQQAEEVAASAIEGLSRVHAIDIAVRRVRSPKDFCDGMHLYQGAFYGLSPAVTPRGQFAHTSPIARLYLAGQTTYPGYGIAPSAMSGIFAAEAVLRTMGV